MEAEHGCMIWGPESATSAVHLQLRQEDGLLSHLALESRAHRVCEVRQPVKFGGRRLCHKPGADVGWNVFSALSGKWGALSGRKVNSPS